MKLTLLLLLLTLGLSQATDEFRIRTDQAGPFRRTMLMSEALEIANSKYHVVEGSITLEGKETKTYELYLDNELLLKLEPWCKEECTLWRIWIYSERYRTNEGIGIGSTVAEILEVYTFDHLQTEGEGDIFLGVQELSVGFALESEVFNDNNWWMNGAKFEDVPTTSTVTFIIP